MAGKLDLRAGTGFCSVTALRWVPSVQRMRVGGILLTWGKTREEPLLRDSLLIAKSCAQAGRMAQWPVILQLAGLGLLDSGNITIARAQAATGDSEARGYGKMPQCGKFGSHVDNSVLFQTEPLAWWAGRHIGIMQVFKDSNLLLSGISELSLRILLLLKPTYILHLASPLACIPLSCTSGGIRRMTVSPSDKLGHLY